MPTSFVLRVTPHGAFSSTQWRGPALHAAFLARINTHDPALATRLHDALPVKPFVLSDLVADGAGAFAWRWTALNDETAEALQSILARGPWRDTLLHTPFHFQWEPAHPWSENVTYEELRAAENLPASYQLIFATTTSFKVDGEPSVLPTPRLLLGSALQRWNHHAPFPLAPELANLIEPLIRVEEAEVVPSCVSAGKKEVKGFTGRLVLRLSRRATPEQAQVAHCLLMYLTLCGAGVKTAMGLGVVLGRPRPKQTGRASPARGHVVEQPAMASVPEDLPVRLAPPVPSQLPAPPILLAGGQ